MSVLCVLLLSGAPAFAANTGQGKPGIAETKTGGQQPHIQGAAKPIDPTAQAAGGAVTGAVAGGAPPPNQACTNTHSATQSLCGNYLKQPRRVKLAQTSEKTSVRDGTKAMEKDLVQLQQADDELAYNCVQAADACVKNCGGSPQNANTCGETKKKATAWHRKFNKEIDEAKEEYRNAGKHREQRPEEDEPTHHALHDGAIGAAAPSSTSPPSIKTESISKTVEKPAEKTPEQLKEERREKRREERRTERIDALGKAFMALAPVKPDQAMGEAPLTPGANQAAAQSAAKIAAAAGNMADAKDDDNDAGGVAGFNALAKKNLEARKALAAKMGINASNLKTSGIRPMGASGGSAKGPVFGGAGGFQSSLGGATLDPVVAVEKPSDLPQNFKLESPSAGGGGGGSEGGTGVAGLTRKRSAQDPNRGPASDSNKPDESDPSLTISPIQLSPHELREKNANLFNVVSASFRKRCADGRLLDCAEHLPRQ